MCLCWLVVGMWLDGNLDLDLDRQNWLLAEHIHKLAFDVFDVDRHSRRNPVLHIVELELV